MRRGLIGLALLVGSLGVPAGAAAQSACYYDSSLSYWYQVAQCERAWTQYQQAYRAWEWRGEYQPGRSTTDWLADLLQPAPPRPGYSAANHLACLLSESRSC
jgi:hypothetical protein